MADSSVVTGLSAIAIEVKQVNKSFGATQALKEINLKKKLTFFKKKFVKGFLL